MTLPEISGFCPLIQVFDMPISLSFYRDLLGFELFQQSSPGDDCDWVWLKRNEAELMLNTMYERDSRPDRPAAGRIMSHSDTGFYIGTPDVDAMYEYLTGRGVIAEAPIVTSYGMKQLYLKDPDGYSICFQWPTSE